MGLKPWVLIPSFDLPTIRSYNVSGCGMYLNAGVACFSFARTLGNLGAPGGCMNHRAGSTPETQSASGKSPSEDSP